MKTGHKLSLIYSGITIGLILIAGLVFYFFTSNYIRNLYFHYMQEEGARSGGGEILRGRTRPGEIPQCGDTAENVNPYVRRSSSSISRTAIWPGRCSARISMMSR